MASKKVTKGKPEGDAPPPPASGQPEATIAKLLYCGSSERVKVTTREVDLRRMMWPDRHVHNSIHPLFVKELGGYLGMAHWYTRSGGFRIRAVSTYGYYYYQAFFLLSATDLQLTKASFPFCFPAVRQNGTARCEAVQFVMNAFREDERYIGISYGINDCESAVARMSVSALAQELVDVDFRVA